MLDSPTEESTAMQAYLPAYMHAYVSTYFARRSPAVFFWRHGRNAPNLQQSSGVGAKKPPPTTPSTPPPPT